MGNITVQALAVFVGGGMGAVLRWLLGRFNSGGASVQLGTLAANLSGALAIGVALAFFRSRPDMGPALRLFCVTGLLGGLTTFSSFSAEIVELFEKNCLSAGFMTIGFNLIGSLVLAALGLFIGTKIWP